MAWRLMPAKMQTEMVGRTVLRAVPLTFLTLFTDFLSFSLRCLRSVYVESGTLVMGVTGACEKFEMAHDWNVTGS